MRLLSALFFVGVVLIWITLAEHSEDAQLVREAVCVIGFAWLALGGWRVMQRRAQAMRDGRDN